MKTIGDCAFSSCSKLNSITLPNSVTTIKDDAFRSCSSLTSITIPGSVNNIGYHAFADCEGLTSVIISSPFKSIPSGAFSGCDNLSSLTIPSSLISIGSEALRFCKKLNKIYITDLEAWCNIEFDSSVWGYDTEPFDEGFHLFINEKEIKDLIIPSSITNIKDYVFKRCSGLTSVKIPNSVTIIGNSAFMDCNNLTQITIGNGIKKIGWMAFAKCSELKDVYCLAEEISSSYNWGQGALYADNNAFDGSYIEYATLHVPESCINNYQITTPWNSFGEYKTLTGEIVETPKCSTPIISIEEGQIKFNCETEGVDFVSNISTTDADNYYDAVLTLTYKYKVTVYATKDGYENSDKASREIVITENGKAILVGDVDGNGKVDVADHVNLSKIIMNQ